MRGRLIFPFLVGYRPLDLSATETAGYDYEFREPALDDDGTQFGASTRREAAEVRIKAQIEPEMLDSLRMFASGDTPESEFVLIHHFKDLERDGLVDGDGNPAIKKGDRVQAIYKMPPSSAKVLDVPAEPGLYVMEVTPRGFGFVTDRNLLKVTLVGRDTGVEA